ncbi:hypothetical protein N9Y74_02760 [Alphaproteobacteria bacterium]|nr:hypothetical protein [Alphaproteobacteria bacterium]
MSKFNIETYQENENRFVKVEFQNAQDTRATARLIFCSKLLHSMAPNTEGIWTTVKKPRTEAHISGFTSDLTWKLDKKCLIGVSLKKINVGAIRRGISNILGRRESEFSQKSYKFVIVNQEKTKKYKTYKYDFDNRSRALVAFCIIWDQQKHPRNNLELTLQQHQDNTLLGKDPSFAGRIYGDPSKTIDELRNQGFPRKTDDSPRGVFIDVSRQTSHGNLQEHYELLRREQSFQDKVGRSQIPPKFRKNLYSIAGNQCSNCGQKYPDNYLAPDHRVPAIVEADNLTETNYLVKLQVLCVRCNQVKREACKKCPYEHNCSKCGWAYPEKHNISILTMKRVQRIAEENGVTPDEMLRSILDRDSSKNT